MTLIKNRALTICFGFIALAIIAALLRNLVDESFTEVGVATAPFDSSSTESTLANESEGTPAALGPEASDGSTFSSANEAVAEPDSSNGVATSATPTSNFDSSSASNDSESTAPELSGRVLLVIEEVQARQLDDQWEEALNEMNALYTEFESLNYFEQVTLLNFYTNALIRLQMWEESISAFSLMRTIPELRPDLNARAIMALGQLHARIGENKSATRYFQEWLTFTEGREGFEPQTERVKQQLEELGSN